MVNNPGIGKALRIPVEGMNVHRVGNTDTAPFRDKKVPVIYFHSLNNKTILTLHTIDGQLSATSAFSELPYAAC